MSETPEAMEAIAQTVLTAMGSEDVAAFAELLDPNVTWGAPDAPHPTCKNRKQVLSWYERGRESGVRGQASEVAVFGDRLLVTLTVRGTQGAQERGGVALRWQVLTVRDGRIIDIVGFDDRMDAMARVGVPG